MKFALLILLISWVAIVGSGCSSPRVLPAVPVERQAPSTLVERAAPAATARAPDVAAGHLPETAPAPSDTQVSELLMYALSMIGVKYKYGGSSMETGFDCSGFVRHVYATAAAIDLPRNARDMSKVGSEVRLADLAPGDLVFYNTQGQRYSHVGIYLGDSRFVHAPSARKSVEIVDMKISYWKRRFDGARRLLAENPAASGGGAGRQTVPSAH